jgi:hypothetical protein
LWRSSWIFSSILKAGIGTVFYIFSFIRDFGKQLIRTGDARFSRGEYTYQKVTNDEKEDYTNRKKKLHANENTIWWISNWRSSWIYTSLLDITISAKKLGTLSALFYTWELCSMKYLPLVLWFWQDQDKNQMMEDSESIKITKHHHHHQNSRNSSNVQIVR